MIGSVFWFSLPYKPDDLAVTFFDLKPAFSTTTGTGKSGSDQQPLQSSTASGGENNALNSPISADALKILLVDDSISSKYFSRLIVIHIYPLHLHNSDHFFFIYYNHTVIKMTGVMLRRQGHEVTEAGNGQEVCIVYYYIYKTYIYVIDVLH